MAANDELPKSTIGQRSGAYFGLGPDNFASTTRRDDRASSASPWSSPCSWSLAALFALSGRQEWERPSLEYPCSRAVRSGIGRELKPDVPKHRERVDYGSWLALGRS
jgi:hypothetical protein